MRRRSQAGLMHWRGVTPADVMAPDHVQITALTRALKVNIKVAYLDGHLHGQEGNVSFVDFTNVEESTIDPVILLYRCVGCSSCLLEATCLWLIDPDITMSSISGARSPWTWSCSERILVHSTEDSLVRLVCPLANVWNRVV